MVEVALAKEYASALLSLVVGEEKAYGEALKAVGEALTEEPLALRFLSSPSVDIKEKEAFLEKSFSSLGLKHLVPFLKTIAIHHRFPAFSQIEAEYRSLLNEMTGVKEGVIYSAVKLSKEEISKVERALAKKIHAQVSLRNVVDPHLLGGVKVALEGKVYDGTLRSRLEELTRALNNA